MIKNNLYFFLIFTFICFPVLADEQDTISCSTSCDRIANPQKGTSVFIIKDVHCHYLMQKQIVNELEKIDASNKIEFIAVEGSSGKLSFDIIQSFPDPNILNYATDSFMKTADLMGVECFASNYLNQGNNIEVLGLEEIKLYIKNKSSFLNAISNSNIIKPISEQAHSIAKKNILGKLPADKSSILSILYNNDTENLINLIAYLETAGFDLNKFNALNKYYSLNGKLKTIRRNNLENESSKLDKFLTGNNYFKLSKKFKDITKKYYAGIISFDSFIHSINDIVKLNNLDFNTPAMDNYIALSNEINSIDFYCLNEEIASIFTQIETSLTANMLPTDLIEKRAVISLIEKLYNTSLKYNEYTTLTDYFKINDSAGLSARIYDLISTYDTLRPDLPEKNKFILLSQPFIDFYNLASKRDQVMADKFLSLLPADSDKKSYVIVAGGFHTEGLSAVLTEKGINHKIIIPKIPKEAKLDTKLYINRITGTNEKFDLALNDYFMGLQVWLNFSSTFPDDASRTTAATFRYKFMSFLVSQAPVLSPAFNDWLAEVSAEQGISASAIAKNREGVICSVTTKDNPDKKFLFEISIDQTGAPVFRHNKYYETAIDALYVEPSNEKLKAISESIYSTVTSEQALMPGSDDFNDLSRFMFMLRLNNPRTFYEIEKQISALLTANYPADKINERAQAVIRFNFVLDEVEATNTFYENRLISLNEVDEFISARRAVVETAYNMYGSNEKFSIILDTASKQAELSASLLLTLGVVDNDWQINHYLGLLAWLLSQNSITPDIADFDFPGQLFDALPPLEFEETNLHQRVESGIENIQNDNYGFNRALNFAQIAVQLSSMLYKLDQGDNQLTPEELIISLANILNDYDSGLLLSPEEFDSFIEKIISANPNFLQPLLRATGEYSVNLSDDYVNAITQNPNLFIASSKSPYTSYYVLASLFARQGNVKGAREFLNKYMEEINRLKDESGFNANQTLIDEIAHQITLVFSKPWVTDLQKYQLMTIYDAFYTLPADIRESAITDLQDVQFRDVTVDDRTRNFISQGRLSQIPANSFNLNVVSLDEGRMVDFSKFAYLPLPGYIQIDRPGKTVPEMASEQTISNSMVLLAAINGSNADWSAPNAFLIKDGELIIKPVPGMNQKERTPLLGNFSVLTFNDRNQPELSTVRIEYDKLINGENIHYGIQGQTILKDGKIYPSPPKPELMGYAQENEVGFNTVTKIRASFSAIGITEDGSILLVTMIGKINIPAVANLLKRAGAKDAILLGGSGDAQQVTLSAEPILAEERWDKPLRAGTYAVRPVNMGLMFFSNSLTTEEMMRNTVQNMLQNQENREILETSL